MCTMYLLHTTQLALAVGNAVIFSRTEFSTKAEKEKKIMCVHIMYADNYLDAALQILFIR